MHLVPLDPIATPALPGLVRGESGTAWAAIVDGVPAFCTEGDARFLVERRRRLVRLLGKPPAAGKPVGSSIGLRRGDVVALSLDGRTMRWRYDPDANLSRPMRLFLGTMRTFGVLACAVTGFWILAECSAYGVGIFWGWNAKGPPTSLAMARAIEDNLYGVYARKPGASEFLKAMGRDRKAGGDPAAFAERWAREHPVASQ